MKRIIFSLLLVVVFSSIAYGQGVVEKDFTKPQATEIWEPRPKIVVPGKNGAPPSDAIILFNGKGMDRWEKAKDGTASQWLVKDDYMTIKSGAGNIRTKQKFGDCQLHVEFMIPLDVKENTVPTNAGNSGVFIQERYEVQIFDSYNNGSPLYANGQMGSIYKQVIPLVNASSKNGEWNTYDIFYTAPTFHTTGSLEKHAYITVLHNGVLILNHFQIQGTIKYVGIPQYELHDKASIELQEHGSEVSFRNIWIREL